MKKRLFLQCGFLAGILLAACRAPAHEIEAMVAKALDGDSVVLSNGEQVRLLGIDCPEKGEPWAAEARDFTRMETEGRWVTLEFGRERRDHYHRLLAYVRYGPRFVNLELVQEGLAHVYLKSRHEKYKNELLDAQRQAMEQKKGIWSQPAVTQGPVISSHQSGVFHRPDCPWATKIPRRSRVEWLNRDDALYAGKSPCRSCHP